MNIGQRIKMRRKELGMSVDKLAELINKNRATIYRYEKNEIENMPYDVIEPLAKVLDVSPSYLMGWDDNEKEEYQPTTIAAHLDGEVSDLDEDEMQKVLEYVKFLKSQQEK